MRACVFALTAALYAAPAAAHTRSTSYSRWTLTDDGATAEARVALVDLTRLGPLESVATDEALARTLPNAIAMARGGVACAVVNGSARRVSSDAGSAALRWAVRCARRGPRALRASLFEREAPSHLHIASVRDATGRASERVLTEGARVWSLDDDAPALRSFGDFVALGVRHILTGVDHLAFLLALALPWRSWRSTLLAITGFTLGHGTSLALAVVGSVATHGRAVESLIGLSVALVAAENIWLARGGRDPALLRATTVGVASIAAGLWLRDGTLALALTGAALFAACTGELLRRGEPPARVRGASAALFGLVHGFGFAGALAPLSLARRGVALALGGFNLGVELGQLAVWAVAAPALLWISRRRDATRAAVEEFASAALVALGVFWCVSRALSR